MVLVDEVDKAGVGRQHGRLWDSLLRSLEPETAPNYPEPHLLVPLDLSRVGYILTCNDVGDLPGPLLDRCRVIEIPAPRSRDLSLLLPPLLRRVTAEAGLDDRWMEPLSPEERALVSRRWRCGSVRHLGRLVEAVLHARDRCRLAH